MIWLLSHFLLCFSSSSSAILAVLCFPELLWFLMPFDLWICRNASVPGSVVKSPSTPGLSQLFLKLFRYLPPLLSTGLEGDSPFGSFSEDPWMPLHKSHAPVSTIMPACPVYIFCSYSANQSVSFLRSLGSVCLWVLIHIWGLTTVKNKKDSELLVSIKDNAHTLIGSWILIDGEMVE